MENNERTRISTEQIASIAIRALGAHARIRAIDEIPGGTFNTIFRLTLAEQGQVILRFAPHRLDRPWNWDETYLMRREHAIQPFFAPVAHLMPKCLLVDFTRQIIDRDYMVQTYLPGERWDYIVDELSPAEHDLLWGQFGRLLKEIHSVQGEMFGLPYPGFQFRTWSRTVTERLESIRQLAAHRQVVIPHLEKILAVIDRHASTLDEIRVPRLLHGDLWLFNLLVTRDPAGPRITGLLDADRAWWGDPAADWAMFLLLHVKPPESIGHETSFWNAYGSEPDQTAGGQFRLSTYLAMHASTTILWARQHGDDETIQRATKTLTEVANHLAAY